MDTRVMPQHIAIIMDRNERQAKKRGLSRIIGHKQGAENIRRIAITYNMVGVKALTRHAFSTENWKRPRDEVDYLCKLPKLFFNRYLAEPKENNIGVTFLGEIKRLPDEIRRVITTAAGQTQESTGLILYLAINHGPCHKITLAAQRCVQDVQWRETNPEAGEDAFSSYMVTADMSELDLMVRTSGELRIGNFLLWQLVYAEFILTPVAWSGLLQEGLNRAIDEFNYRNRRSKGL